MSATISKGELAAELKLTRARVSQFVAAGLPVRPDGRLNRDEALAWCREHWRPNSGGWGVNGRATRTARAKAEKQVVAVSAESDYERLSDYGRGFVDAVNFMRDPHHVKAFAEVAASHGCTAAQSYGTAQTVALFMGIWSSDMAARMLDLSAGEAFVVQVYEEEPDWSELAAITGEPIDVKSWKAASRRAMKAWGKREKESN
jgi:hypothetical protein